MSTYYFVQTLFEKFLNLFFNVIGPLRLICAAIYCQFRNFIILLRIVDKLKESASAY